MRDITDVVKNISEIYDSDVAFTVLKDFERVLDDLDIYVCLLYTSPSPRDKRQSRMPSSA